MMKKLMVLGAVFALGMVIASNSAMACAGCGCTAKKEVKAAVKAVEKAECCKVAAAKGEKCAKCAAVKAACKKDCKKDAASCGKCVEKKAAAAVGEAKSCSKSAKKCPFSKK